MKKEVDSTVTKMFLESSDARGLVSLGLAPDETDETDSGRSSSAAADSSRDGDTQNRGTLEVSPVC